MGAFLRHMDDIVVLAPSRWKLREAVWLVNQTLNRLGLEEQPEKIFIGRIERGFDFLRHHFRQAGLPWPKRRLSVSLNVRTGFMSKSRGSLFDSSRLGQYVQRWVRLARGRL
jgi:RNA-directed DNA polymerase